MSLILIAVVIWLVAGCLALAAARSPKFVCTVAPAAVVIGCLLTAVEAIWRHMGSRGVALRQDTSVSIA